MRDMKKISQKNQEYHERSNPCIKEEVLSRKCLEKNNYEYEKCNNHFLNVKNCREFWETIKRERRIRGIKPELPPPSERPQIKEEFLRQQQYSKK